MKLTQWSPFMEMEGFEEFFKGFTPAMDVYETEEAVIVEAPVPNLDPSKVEISITNDVLTIQGSSEKKSEVEDKAYYRKEVRTGSFHRTIPLPASVQGEKASAVYENGTLKISVPKAEQVKKNKINIQIKK